MRQDPPKPCPDSPDVAPSAGADAVGVVGGEFWVLSGRVLGC